MDAFFKKSTRGRCMGLCVALLLLLHFLPVSVYAAFDQLIPQRQRGKFFTPSIRLRQEYSDNIAYKRGSAGGRGPGQQRIKSWISYVEPKVSVRLPFDQTFVGIDYKYSLAYYWDRPYDNEDTAHDLTFRFKHEFSPRLSLDITNNYINHQSGPIKRASDIPGAPDVVIRTEGDFEQNVFESSLQYYLMRYLFVSFKYGNTILDFDTRDASETFDYLEHRLSFESGYVLNKDVLLLGGYRFTDRTYDLRDNSDYDGHMLFGGVNYRLGKYFTLDASGGVEFRKPGAPSRGVPGLDYDAIPRIPEPGVPFVDVFGPTKVGSTKIAKNPFVDVKLISNYFRDMVITLGYRYYVSKTEQESFDNADVQTASLLISYKILPKVTLDLSAIYSVDQYSGETFGTELDTSVVPTTIVKYRVLDDPETKLFRLGAVVSYQITPWMFYEIGYRRTDADSDFENATWEKNDYFTGINAIF